ncbi:hypothetical protein GCM10010967_08180 [Dyadobacter beijingensis]|uniref:BioF2-like acetyltransferase domain-containing protein n=1 Tax=Dyadobacter beijingensis TaxID=365489 RepID=A0ABQ2HH51_9BACT|nr:hypothetical protein GCM10010967_08180 [Dyadobacter beijingensis]
MKGKKAGLEMSWKTGPIDETVVGFLRRCSAAHGYECAESLEKLANSTSLNPGNYVILTAVLHDKPVAAAVMVRVSDTILYHYTSGYLPEYRSLSPSLVLFEAAFAYARRENMALLDLGISLDHRGHGKPSLSRFKERIGGKECVKIVYRAVLA